MDGLSKRITNLMSEYCRFVDLAASITPLDGLQKRFSGQPKTTTGISPAVVTELESGELELFYQKGKQVISLTHTRCLRGGGRLWFKCPGCDRRCGKLYKPLFESDYFCRDCHGLIYRSERQGATLQEIDDMLEIFMAIPKATK